MSTYLPDWLPVEDVYQPPTPRTEDLAVLLEGDEEEADVEALRRKGKWGSWWCVMSQV